MLPERDLVPRIGPADREIVLTLFLVECERKCPFLLNLHIFPKTGGRKKKKTKTETLSKQQTGNLFNKNDLIIFLVPKVNRWRYREPFMANA